MKPLVGIVLTIKVGIIGIDSINGYQLLTLGLLNLEILQGDMTVLKIGIKI